MKKVLLFTTAVALTVGVVIAPVKKADAFICGIPCLLQMGGQIITDLKNQVERISSGVEETVQSWLSEANTQLRDFLSDGMSAGRGSSSGKGGTTTAGTSNGTSGKGTSSGGGSGGRSAGRVASVTNLAASETGIAKHESYNYTVTMMDGSSSDAGQQTENVEAAAQAKINEKLAVSGTYAGRQKEAKRKQYIAQRDAIDTLARALVVKNVLEELKKAGDQLDDLQESIVPNSTPYVMSGQKPAGTVKTRDVETALRDNLDVRLFYDNLLTLQQQLLAMRLKSRTLAVFGGMPAVSNVTKLKEYKDEDYDLPEASEYNADDEVKPAVYDSKEGE